MERSPKRSKTSIGKAKLMGGFTSKPSAKKKGSLGKQAKSVKPIPHNKLKVPMLKPTPSDKKLSSGRRIKTTRTLSTELPGISKEFAHVEHRSSYINSSQHDRVEMHDVSIEPAIWNESSSDMKIKPEDIPTLEYYSQPTVTCSVVGILRQPTSPKPKNRHITIVVPPASLSARPATVYSSSEIAGITRSLRTSQAVTPRPSKPIHNRKVPHSIPYSLSAARLLRHSKRVIARAPIPAILTQESSQMPAKSKLTEHLDSKSYKYFKLYSKMCPNFAVSMRRSYDPKVALLFSTELPEDTPDSSLIEGRVLPRPLCH